MAALPAVQNNEETISSYIDAQRSAGGIEDATWANQFGSGVGLFAPSGTLGVIVNSTAVSPYTTGVDAIIGVFKVNANSFDGVNYPAFQLGGAQNNFNAAPLSAAIDNSGVNGSLNGVLSKRGLSLNLTGLFGANTNSKTVKIIVNPTTIPVVGATVAGGTTIASTGVVASNALVFSMEVAIFKYGAPGSNTQLAIHSGTQIGAGVIAPTAPQLLTIPENQDVYIAITGNSATTAADILLYFALLEAYN